MRCRNSTAMRWSVVTIRSIGEEEREDCADAGNRTSEIGDPPSSAEAQYKGRRADAKNTNDGLSTDEAPVEG